MIKYILIAVVLIIILILIYNFIIRDKDGEKRSQSNKLLAESAGTFDDQARRALAELTAIDNPQPEDHFQRAEIIRYNLLEGNVVAGGNIEPEIRRAAVGNIVRDYTNTLHGIRAEIGRGGARQRHENAIDPGFMLFHIADLNGMLGNAAQAEEDWDILQMIGMFNNLVTTEVPQAQNDIARQRVAEAVASSTNRTEAINRTLDNAVVYTNQLQNVHDSAVNSDLNITLRKLRATYGITDDNSTIVNVVNTGKAFKEAEDYINDEFINADILNPVSQVNAAKHTLGVLSRGEYIMTFNSTESEIFALVWERWKHPNNAGARNKMKEAIGLALSDCFELYKGRPDPVCINGRCARILGSLALLDYDKSVGDAMTCEAYKNQIFQQTKEIINEEIETAKKSNDPDLQKVAQLYDGEDIEVDKLAEGRFKEILKRRIDENINDYREKLKPNDLDSVRDECYVYAMLS